MNVQEQWLLLWQENYTADRLVLAASGANHQRLLDIAEPLLSDLAKGSPVIKPKSAYTGGDFRHKTDSEVISYSVFIFRPLML